MGDVVFLPISELFRGYGRELEDIYVSPWMYTLYMCSTLRFAVYSGHKKSRNILQYSNFKGGNSLVLFLVGEGGGG